MTASGVWGLTAIPCYLDGEVSIGVAPRLTGVIPGDVEQGSSISATLNGTRLAGAQTVSFTASGLTASILPGASDTAVPVQLTVGSSVPFGPVDVTVAAAAGTQACRTASTSYHRSRASRGSSPTGYSSIVPPRRWILPARILLPVRRRT